MSYVSVKLAAEKGAWSVAANNMGLWRYSKRELIEAALWLAAAQAECAETALENGAAAETVGREITTLKKAGLV